MNTGAFPKSGPNEQPSHCEPSRSLYRQIVGRYTRRLCDRLQPARSRCSALSALKQGCVRGGRRPSVYPARRQEHHAMQSDRHRGRGVRENSFRPSLVLRSPKCAPGGPRRTIPAHRHPIHGYLEDRTGNAPHHQAGQMATTIPPEAVHRLGAERVRAQTRDCSYQRIASNASPWRFSRTPREPVRASTGNLRRQTSIPIISR